MARSAKALKVTTEDFEGKGKKSQEGVRNM
jgi:hypothetical protein